MPAIPTVTNVSTVNYVIDTGTPVSYQFFLNSLGPMQYKVTSIYMRSENESQINVTFNAVKRNVDGSITTFPITSPQNLFTPANGVNIIDLKDINVVLDGTLSLDFDLLANTNLTLMLGVTATQVNKLELPNN